MSFFPNPEIVSMLTATGQWDTLRDYMNTGSSLSSSAVPYYPGKPRSIGIEWSKVLKIIFTLKWKKSPISKHFMLFKIFKTDYETHPERFTLSSEGHHSADGRYYFSVRYCKENSKGSFIVTNFHIYGRTEGFKFMCESVDILMGKDDIYTDAVVY